MERLVVLVAGDPSAHDRSWHGRVAGKHLFQQPVCTHFRLQCSPVLRTAGRLRTASSPCLQHKADIAQSDKLHF